MRCKVIVSHSIPGAGYTNPPPGEYYRKCGPMTFYVMSVKPGYRFLYWEIDRGVYPRPVVPYHLRPGRTTVARAVFMRESKIVPPPPFPLW